DLSDKKSEREGWLERRAEEYVEPKKDSQRSSDVIVKKHEKLPQQTPQLKTKVVAGISAKHGAHIENGTAEQDLASDFARQCDRSHNSSSEGAAVLPRWVFYYTCHCCGSEGYTSIYRLNSKRWSSSPRKYCSEKRIKPIIPCTSSRLGIQGIRTVILPPL
ncbi:hypothetical protein NDU88_000057, partial [Pleurodeles waltl]